MKFGLTGRFAPNRELISEHPPEVWVRSKNPPLGSFWLTAESRERLKLSCRSGVSRELFLCQFICALRRPYDGAKTCLFPNALQRM